MENQRNDPNGNGIDRPTTTSTSITNNVTTTTTSTSNVSTTITRLGPITTSNNNPTTTNRNGATTSSNNDGITAAGNMSTTATMSAIFNIDDEAVTQTAHVNVIGTAFIVTSTLESVTGNSTFNAVIVIGGPRIQLFNPRLSVNPQTNNDAPTTINGFSTTNGAPTPAIDMEPEVFTGDGITVEIQVVRRHIFVATTVPSRTCNCTFNVHIALGSTGPRIMMFIPRFSVNPQN